MSKKRGTSGSIAVINEPYADEIKYCLNDLLYLYSRKEYIEKIYKFLRFLENNNGANPVKVVYKEMKLDFGFSKVLKEMEIINQNFVWITEENPSQKLAVDVALRKWKLNKKANPKGSL